MSPRSREGGPGAMGRERPERIPGARKDKISYQEAIRCANKAPLPDNIRAGDQEEARSLVTKVIEGIIKNTVAGSTALITVGTITKALGGLVSNCMWAEMFGVAYAVMLIAIYFIHYAISRRN